MDKVLITGGSGFVGNHLIKKLADQYPLIVFDKKCTKEKFSGVTYINGDLRSYEDLKKTDIDLNGIVHLGGISRVKDGVNNPLFCVDVNVMGTANILELARNSKNRPWVILGSTVEKSNNIYGLSKKMAEQCAEMYARDYSLRVLSTQFTSIYGYPYDNPDKLIPKLILRALSNQDIVIDNGEMAFDFLHIEDLVAGICSGIRYLEDCKKSSFDVVPLCTGNSVTLKNLAEIIVRETDSTSRIIVKSEEDEDVPLCSSERAKEVLNFTAHTEIGEGLRKTIRSIRKTEDRMQ